MTINSTLITTSQNPTNPATLTLQSELLKLIPHSFTCTKQMSPPHTIQIKIVEHLKRPYLLRFTHTSLNTKIPQIELTIIEYKSCAKLQKKELVPYLTPELVISGFQSENGSLVADWLMQIFPMDLDVLANRTVSFCAYNDFILFRTFRYRFKDGKNVQFQDVGPHLMFRLRKVVKSNGDEEIFRYEKNKYDNANIVL